MLYHCDMKTNSSSSWILQSMKEQPLDLISSQQQWRQPFSWHLPFHHTCCRNTCSHLFSCLFSHQKSTKRLFNIHHKDRHALFIIVNKYQAFEYYLHYNQKRVASKDALNITCWCGSCSQSTNNNLMNHLSDALVPYAARVRHSYKLSPQRQHSC